MRETKTFQFHKSVAILVHRSFGAQCTIHGPDLGSSLFYVRDIPLALFWKGDNCMLCADFTSVSLVKNVFRIKVVIGKGDQRDKEV